MLESRERYPPNRSDNGIVNSRLFSYKLFTSCWGEPLNTMAVLVAFASHQPVWHGFIIAGTSPKPLGYGHGLPFVYAMWVLAVAILYLHSLWFMELRRRHRDWVWLSYL